MSNDNDRAVKILLDADVIIHFVKGDRLSLLNELFPNRMVLLNIVESELTTNPSNEVGIAITNFIRFGLIEVVPFPTKNLEIITEYARLIRQKGKGESACLAVCRYNSHIIASSNLSDIQSYCDTHELAYITTLDILCIGMRKNKITEKECDAFIQEVRSKNSKLPNITISEYHNVHFEASKHNY